MCLPSLLACASTRAEITRPSVVRDLLILMASLSCSPSAPESAKHSLPVKCREGTFPTRKHKFCSACQQLVWLSFQPPGSAKLVGELPEKQHVVAADTQNHTVLLCQSPCTRQCVHAVQMFSQRCVFTPGNMHTIGHNHQTERLGGADAVRTASIALKQQILTFNLAKSR